MRADPWQFLPHGHPFVFVDRVVELVPGVRAAGRKLVTANEELALGSTRGGLAFPGVLLIEGLAQLGGMAWLGADSVSGGRLAAIADARLPEALQPGDVVELEAAVVRAMGSLARVEGRARVGGREVASAELTLVRGGP